MNIFCSNKTWLESAAVDQFNNVLSLEGVIDGAAFPDLHPGRGIPVGAAFLSRSVIYPHLIGNDIGCGMTLFKLDVPARKLKIDRLLKKLGDDPESVIQQFALASVPEMQSHVDDSFGILGTIGHGNHFIEILSVEKVLDEDVFSKLDLKKDAALLLVHCGSRVYGEALWRDYSSRNGSNGVSPTNEHGARYLSEHQRLIEWAYYNRRLVAKAISRLLSCEVTGILDCVHNSIRAVGDGTYIHRKGASEVNGGPVIVAGSRGTLSYLVSPTGNVSSSLHSLSHGCGRKWNRQSTKDRVREKHSDVNSLYQTSLGTKVVCPDKTLLYEEAPEAYKSIESVMDDLKSFGLASPIASLKPIVNIKP